MRVHNAFRWLSRLNTRTPVAWLALPFVAAISFVAISDPTPPVIPAINLSADPLYAAAAVDKPALALALSVEFPTVGAQYMDDTLAAGASSSLDATYANTKEYLGYYDAESCYSYNKTGSDAPSGATADDYKRFDRIGPAIALATPDTTNPAKTSRMCTDAFSGNFLNWATNSAIDMLRLSLTGGDRYIDTSGTYNTDGSVITYPMTILQRAVLPNGDPMCMWNSSNFPAKQLKKAAGTGVTDYFGAIPTAMVTEANGSDIFVANTLNRIYFGTSQGGGCGNTSGYALGAPTAAATSGLPSDAVECANENGTCSGFTGTKQIWYGANTKWNIQPKSASVACNNATFGDPIVGTAKKCYYSAFNTSTPTASTSLNADGYFYSRVQVCNVNSAGTLLDSRDYKLCVKYPNGNYKPAGVIQKYSDQMRLAAFGYVMDQTASYSSGRYGGVLRAPMKYLGYSTFDETGVNNTPTGGNAKAEWNISTGVFNPNPDGNTTVATSTVGRPNGASAYLSGVISYVNQFGRTGSVSGRYKKYDPVGELHYETLRYLQGLSPSADAVSSITTDMQDGYPVFTSWTDPYAGRSATSDYTCVKSNIVVIGDINTHDGNRLPSADAANNIPDINAWRTVVQKFEKKNSGTYVDGQGVTQYISNPNSANGSVPSGTQTSQIMGSAYWARTHDIRGTGWTGNTSAQRPGLRVKTFTFDVNEYNAQANASTRRTANQFFMASKYGGFETDASSAATSIVAGKSTKDTYNTKGNPFYRDDMTTADAYVWKDTDARASRQDEANTYFLQSDARGVLSAFDDIFKRASSALASIAGGAIQSQKKQVNNTIYQGYFDTLDWNGNLKAFVLDTTGTPATSPTWTAADRLAALTDPAGSRNIIIGNAGATASPVAAPFSWATPAGSSGIEDSLRTALDKATSSATADGLAEHRLNYIRGSRTKESNPFRSRSSLMGDVVNSNVVYSGAPVHGSNKTRTHAVFVGANDGMLHAFVGKVGATDTTKALGDELFAYIPSWIGPKLSALTNATYVTNHQAFVDGSSDVAEAQVGSNWKTVLVGSTGAGGQGVFALDVSAPASFTAANVMWEFTDADDPDLGNVTGRPQILKMRTSASGSTATYKWFAVFGSGANNYVNDGSGRFSTTGSPALFLLDLSKAAGVAWTLGTNYYKISLPLSGTSIATGLLNFSTVLGLDGAVSLMYMGDLHGNLWKLDFSFAGTADWNINKLSSFNKGTASSPIPYPMFIAKDSGGNVQPISAAPTVVQGPTLDTYYVMLGTGKYLETTDRGSTATQSVYMVYDNGSTSGDSNPVGDSAISGRARLKAGTGNATTGVVTIPTFTLGRATSNTDSDNPRSGWYFDLPTSKERQIYDGAVSPEGRYVIFNSLIPSASGTVGTCSPSGGGGNTYRCEVANGGSCTGSSSGNSNILGEPLIVETNTASTVTDSSGGSVDTITQTVLQIGSNGAQFLTTLITKLGDKASETLGLGSGRLNWRQINNYQELKNAP